MSNEFCQRGLTTINFLRIFGVRTIKTKLANFFKFQSISIHAIRSVVAFHKVAK